MSNVDERVVRMSFDNAQFQAGVRATLADLDALNKGLKLQGATKGLSDLGSAANGLKLDRLGAGVDAIKNKFSSLSIVGIAALANLSNRAVDAGLRLVKSFTIAPITAGFKNYETQINAVQTIMANTGLKGASGLKQVTGVLDELNEYANKTVYSFSEMAKNVGTFSAAGVKLDVASKAIKGIANLAALSGSNSEQASTAMYQLSQAIAANKVGLQDWNSVVNAGLGGEIFQKSLFETGQKLGTIKNLKMGETFEEWKKGGNSFRGSLQDGWITGEVLTKTLGKFTGDLTEAELKSQGYNAEQIKQIQELGKTAVGAATKIKTMSQLTDALKEEVASAYASVFKTLFGDINEATGMFTGLHTVIQNMLTGPIYAFNDVLKEWVKFGGKIAFVDALKQASRILGEILKPIKEAFREIFPATSGKSLAALTKGLDAFLKGIKIGVETGKELRSTFAGVFAIFSIVWQVIKQTAQWLGSLLGPVLGKGSGGLLKFTAGLGDMLVHFEKIVKKGQGLNQFFMAISTVLAPVLNFIAMLGQKLGELPSKIGPFFDQLGEWFSNIPNLIGPAFDAVREFITNVFGNIDWNDVMSVVSVGLFGALVFAIRGLVKKLKNAVPSGNPFTGLISSITAPFHALTETLESMQQTLKAATILEIAVAVALLAGSVFALSKINDKDLQKSLGALANMFVQLFVALAAFNRIGGATGLIATGAGLILVATAIRILVFSVKELATMKIEELKKGLASLGIILAALIITVRGMSAQSAGMVTTGAGLILLAAAIKILVSSVQDFSKMSWQEIGKGLAGVASLLLALTLFTKFAALNKGAIAQGAGIILLAAGIKILASAAQDFAKMDWNAIGKGLVSISGILLAVGVFSKTAGNPATLLAAGISLIGIAEAMIIFARAMEAFGKISWQNTAKGLISMGVALAIITTALNFMPTGMIATSIGLIAIGVALNLMAKALKSMGKQSWNEIAKGLVTLAVALGVIAIATIAMEEALPGAAAVLVVSYALGMLADALVKMGSQSWGDIGKGLATLAGAFIVLGVAGLALTPVAPTLLILGAAIALLGVGVGLLGAGVLALSIGLTGLAASGAAGAAAITTIFLAMIAILPKLAVGLGVFLVSLSEAIIKATPAVLQAAIVLIDGLLKAIAQETPKIIATFIGLVLNLLTQLAQAAPKFLDKATRLILAILEGITRNAPKIINAFITMIVSLLNAIASNIPRFAVSAANLIATFLNAIAQNIGKIIDAGVNIIIAVVAGIGKAAYKLVDAALDTLIRFLNALADSIGDQIAAIEEAGIRIAAAIVTGIIKGLANGVIDIVKGAVSLAKSAYDGVMDFIGAKSPSKLFMKVGGYITQGLAIGLTGGKADVKEAYTKLTGLIKDGLAGLKDNIDKFTVKLAQLNAAHQKNALAIYLTTLQLQQARQEYAKLSQASADLSKNHSAQYNRLMQLGKAYDAVTKKLTTATDKLKDAKKVRDDYISSIKDEQSQLPEITAETNLTDYTNSVTYQIADLKKFTEVLAKLRKLGLNDTVYKKLVAEGPQSLAFAEQLLAGGKTAVDNVDSLSNQLTSAAGAMAKAAGTAMYQAGVDSAQGVVDGLKKQQGAINAQMSAIAKAMVKQIKKDLGIRSPSKVFNTLGQFVTKGLAAGLKNATPAVEDASSYVGKTALDSMSKALAGASDLVSNSVNLNPVIAPVVDLSNVSKGVSQLGKMLTDKQLGIDTSFSMAKNASAGISANKAAAIEALKLPTADTGVKEVTFIQNNNSPKALSAAEIYRQTNNQLSRAKGALYVTQGS